MAPEGTWIAADWGTTHLRVWLMNAEGQSLKQARSEKGMAALEAGEFEPALPPLQRACEGPLLVPEELALDKRLRNRCGFGLITLDRTQAMGTDMADRSSPDTCRFQSAIQDISKRRFIIRDTGLAGDQHLAFAHNHDSFA